MIVRLVRGSETIVLSGDGGVIAGCNYVPRSPARGAAEMSESPEVVFAGPEETVKAKVHQIDAWLETAKQRQDTDQGDQVFIEIQMSPTDDVYRSEVLDGRAEWPQDTVLGLRGQVLTLPVFWSRLPFWEGPETEVPLSNGNGSGLGGRAIFNNGDGSGSSPNVQHNHVQIAAADVGADIASPCRIEFTNLQAGILVRDLYIGQSRHPNPASLVHVVEAEDATGKTPSVDVTCSNDNYAVTTLSGDSEQDAYRWTIETGALDAFGDLPYKLLLRWRTRPTGVTYGRFRVEYGGQALFTQPAQKVLSTVEYLEDLGTVWLGPRRMPGSRHPLDLILRGQKTGGDSWELDYVGILAMGVNGDGFRLLKAVTGAAGLEQNATLYDDMIANPPAIWTDGHASAGDAPNFILDSDPLRPLMLWPKLQRLYFWWADSAGAALPAWAASVSVHVRPRRRLP